MKIKALSLALMTLSLGAFFAVTHAEYEAQIKQCLDAKEQNQESTITDFICTDGDVSDAYAAYQVVLDLEMQKVDKEADSKIELLSTPEYKGKTPAELSKIISGWFGLYGDNDGFFMKYRSVCNNNVVVTEAAKVISLSTEDGISQVLAGNQTCNDLSFKKLSAYYDAAWLVTGRNRVENFQSDKHDFMEKTNKVYESLLMKWIRYVGQLDRVRAKWDGPIKDPMQ